MALALTAWTVIAPAVVSARPLRAERVSPWKTTVSALMTWWGIFGIAGRGTAPALRTDWTKNGCGIDPNGLPLLCTSLPGGGGVGGAGLEGGSEDDPADSGY